MYQAMFVMIRTYEVYNDMANPIEMHSALVVRWKLSLPQILNAACRSRLTR